MPQDQTRGCASWRPQSPFLPFQVPTPHPQDALLPPYHQSLSLAFTLGVTDVLEAGAKPLSRGAHCRHSGVLLQPQDGRPKGSGMPSWWQGAIHLGRHLSMPTAHWKWQRQPRKRGSSRSALPHDRGPGSGSRSSRQDLVKTSKVPRSMGGR